MFPELRRVTLRVQHDGRSFTVEVAADGEGLVSRAGAALLAQVPDKVGLTNALSLRLAGVKQRRRGHDRGRVIRDLAVMLAAGGECVSDLGAVLDQEALFGVCFTYRTIRANAYLPVGGLRPETITRFPRHARREGAAEA